MAGSAPSLPSELLGRASQALAPLLREVSRPRALAALTAGSALWYIWRWRRRAALGKFTEVPGLPFIGVAHKIVVDHYLNTMEEWSREYGKEEGVFEISILGERTVIFSSWEACQPIAAARPFKVTRPSTYLNIDMLGNEIGLFFAEGRQWSSQRRLVSPAFNQKAIDSYMPAVCGIVQNLLELLRLRAAEKRAANVTDLARRMNADIISKVAFGKEFGALFTDSPELKDMMTYLDAMIARVTSPFPYWKLPFGGRVDSGKETADRIRKRVHKFLSDPASSVDTTLLGKLMHAEGERLTHDELLGNVLVLFIAGTDTTSHTLSWAFYELSLQPELQEELAAEVAKVPAGLEGAQQTKELLLVQALWLETLRFRSVAPALDFETQEPIVVMGRTLPPKTAVWFLMREMTRNSPEFRAAVGEDLDNFRPKRWLAPGGGLVECKPLDAIAFGHGARMCVGKNLANFVGPFVLAEVLRHFRIERWAGPPVSERTSFVQCPAQDIELRFVARG